MTLPLDPRSGVQVTVTPSGGNGEYVYYSIELYYNGELIGKTSDTSSNQLFINQNSSGTYKTIVVVKDTYGNETKTESTVKTNM